MFAAPATRFVSLVSELDPAVRRALAAAVSFLVIFLVGRLFLTPALVRVFRRRNPDNPTIREAIELYLRLSVLVVAVGAAVVAAGFGDLLTNSALVVAAATLAVGVAGQAVIGNLVSGFFLVTDPNFNVGDYIAWNDREGTVEAIRFRSTRVRTADHHEVTVPNTELAANTVVRPYSRSRIRGSVRLPFDDDVDVAAVEAALAPRIAELSDVRAEPRPTASITEFGDSAVWITVHYWLANPMEADVGAADAGVTRRIKAVCDEEGLPLGPPNYQHLSGDVSVGETR